MQSSTRGQETFAPNSSGAEALVNHYFFERLFDATERGLSTYNDYDVPHARRATRVRTALSFRDIPTLLACNGAIETPGMHWMNRAARLFDPDSLNRQDLQCWTGHQD
ncbi:MAG: hypothetical protein SGJ20_13490 [Planctomycetota bacterium]|nr:hypothetical protein [Planctomycetota bacterium]